MYDPEHKSGKPVLDNAFSGGLPLIRGPVSVKDGMLVQDDGDILLADYDLTEPDVLFLLEYAINKAYSEWERTPVQKCEAVLCAGPGHQSKFKCERTDFPHRIHRDCHGRAWVGDKGYTGYFDEEMDIPEGEYQAELIEQLEAGKSPE